jgi:hypothetical protein
MVTECNGLAEEHKRDRKKVLPDYSAATLALDLVDRKGDKLRACSDIWLTVERDSQSRPAIAWSSRATT